jgi:hypothetical protein
MENKNTNTKRRGRKPKADEVTPVAAVEENSNTVVEQETAEEPIPNNNNDNDNNDNNNNNNNNNINNTNDVVNDAADNDSDDGIMKTKRRGRKPKDKFKYESTDYEDFQKNSKKEDNIIVKLPLSCLKLNEEFNVGKDLFPYNPNITTPKPYNPDNFIGLSNKHGIGYSMINEDDNLSEENEMVGTFNSIAGISHNNSNSNSINNLNEAGGGGVGCGGNGIGIGIGIGIGKELKFAGTSNTYCDKCTHCRQQKIGSDQQQPEARQIDIILNNKYNSNTDKFNLLTHLSVAVNGNKWIEKTEVACLWCCHQFKTVPWGIPYKFVNGVFQLFGNFCMPNCALAYILKFYNDDDSLWEKVALLNLLYFKVHGQYKNLVPSYDKMALKQFGGTLEIDEYRNLISSNDKAYNVEFPPCNTIIPMLEEIYKKTQLNNTFIPVDKNRINIANNELKLKRSKPIINHKNTLDFCLGGK